MVFYHFRIADVIHLGQNMIAQGPTSTSVRVLNKKREHMQCLLVREWGGGVAEEAGAAPRPAGGRQQRHSSLADSEEDNASDEESSGVKLKVKGIRSKKVSGSLLPVQW